MRWRKHQGGRVSSDGRVEIQKVTEDTFGGGPIDWVIWIDGVHMEVSFTQLWQAKEWVETNWLAQQLLSKPASENPNTFNFNDYTTPEYDF